MFKNERRAGILINIFDKIYELTIVRNLQKRRFYGPCNFVIQVRLFNKQIILMNENEKKRLNRMK